MTANEPGKVGILLREWRGRRRLSQLDLAYGADISPKHLSFLETGRAQPSREMILRLAEQMEIPLREQNILLTTAGYAAVFPERALSDESLSAARKAVDLILTGLGPNPAFAVDRYWNLVAANKAVDILIADVAPALLEPPVNILRICLHPDGFTPNIINYLEWRRYVIEYLDRQVGLTGDRYLMTLLEELKSYPMPKSLKDKVAPNEIDYSRFAIPLQLKTREGDLSLVSTMTVFGTPVDVTLSELAIESYFPADANTATILNRFHQRTNQN